LICAVYRGVVRQVYRPAGPNAWFPAGTTLYKTREVEMDKPGEKYPRWEFVGRVAEEAILKRFVGRDASDFLAGANPINYVHPG